MNDLNNPGLAQWYEKLIVMRKQDDCLHHYMQLLHRSGGGASVIYLNYVKNHRTLVVSDAVGVPLKSGLRLGVDLKQEEGDLFVSEYLKKPETIKSIQSFVSRVFSPIDFYYQPVVIEDEVVGMFVVFKKDERKIEEDIYFKMLRERLTHLYWHAKYLKVNVLDETTDVFHRQHFLVRTAEEISRSRRIKMPVSLILVSLDGFSKFQKHAPMDDGDLLMTLLAKVFLENSRKTDIIGRIGQGELGLLLPHTPVKGAAIKSERMRRLIESADFTGSIKTAPRFTISAGVSEYPSQCHDDDELFARADSALFDMIDKGGNKVCVAAPPLNFIPDFICDLDINPVKTRR